MEGVKTKQLARLEQISGLTSAEAKQELLEAVESEMKAEASRRLWEWEPKIRAEAAERAQGILVQAIQRMCVRDYDRRHGFYSADS